MPNFDRENVLPRVREVSGTAVQDGAGTIADPGQVTGDVNIITDPLANQRRRLYRARYIYRFDLTNVNAAGREVRVFAADTGNHARREIRRLTMAGGAQVTLGGDPEDPLHRIAPVTSETVGPVATPVQENQVRFGNSGVGADIQIVYAMFELPG